MVVTTNKGIYLFNRFFTIDFFIRSNEGDCKKKIEIGGEEKREHQDDGEGDLF